MGVDILQSPLCGVIIARFFSNLMGIFSFKEFAQGWKKLLELAVNFYVLIKQKKLPIQKIQSFPNSHALRY